MNARCARSAALGIIACAMLTGVGCGGDAGDDKQEPRPPSTSKRMVRVAAAADLKFALDEIIVAFATTNPAIEVNPTYGSSGNFFSQLSNKAPYDLFLSADIDYPRKLVEAGHATQEAPFDYAVGRIVVWVRRDSPIDVEQRGIESLAHASVKRIAIANPRHAPYGRAAEAAMKTLGIHERVKDRLVLGENVAQAAQFVEAGAADIGVIALSLALAPAMKDQGKYWPVPRDAYPTLRQGGVIPAWAKDTDAAQQLQVFITAATGRSILKRHGFDLPGE